MTTQPKLKKAKASALAAAADRIGQLKIQMAQLEREQAELKQLFIDAGKPAYDGEVYRVTITHVDRTTLDTKAIRAEMPAKWIANHSVTSKVTQMHVAHLGDIPNIVRLPK